MAPISLDMIKRFSFEISSNTCTARFSAGAAGAPAPPAPAAPPPLPPRPAPRPLPADPCGVVICTFAFGVRRDWPSVTTWSPLRIPEAITDIDGIRAEQVRLEGYESHPLLRGEVAV